MKYLTAVAAATLAVSGLVEPLNAQTVWRMPAAVTEGSVLYEKFVSKFAENVELLTEGEVVIEPYGAGVIVPAFEIHDAIRNGVVEAGNTAPAYLVNADPSNALFAGLPGGMSADEKIAWYYYGGGEALFQELRREKLGLHSMAVGFGSTEVFAHSTVPIESVGDLQGLKFRSSGPQAAVLGELGAVPTVVPGGEIYTLLERRGVDAVEFSTPAVNLVEGFHRVARHLVLPGVHQPTFLWEVSVDAGTWDALPEELQRRVEAAAKLTALESLPSLRHADLHAIEQFRGADVTIHILSDEVIDEIGRLGIDWAKREAAKATESGNPHMQSILDEYLSYRELWERNSVYAIK